MKKAYKSLYLEAMKDIEDYKEALETTDAIVKDRLDEKDRIIDETLNRLNGIASNNVILRDKVNRYRVISFMLAMGMLAQYCLFMYY